MNLERKKEKKQAIKDKFSGTGQYLFENNTNGDLILPKTTNMGIKYVGKGKQFIGDSFYFNLVGRDLKLIKTLQETVKENDNRLITEQPPVVTHQGTVEFVEEKKKKLNEDKEHPTDILLTESPFDGVKIIH